jgi:hypothetical protein
MTTRHWRPSQMYSSCRTNSASGVMMATASRITVITSQSALKQPLTNSVAANKNVFALNSIFTMVSRLRSVWTEPRENTTPPSRLFPQATNTAGTTPVTQHPPPAPKKLNKLNNTMELKFFNAKDVHNLSKIADMQRWYNYLHSKGPVYGVFTPPLGKFCQV